MPANLADAMIRLLDGPANEGLATLSQILKRGQSTLGQLWTSHLSPQDKEDLRAASTVLPGLKAQFEAAQPICNDTPDLWTQKCWRDRSKFSTVSRAPCLDFATCRYPPTHGW